MSWLTSILRKRALRHVCVATIHVPMCAYKPEVKSDPDKLSWNDLNYAWCEAFCIQLSVTPEILEARTRIIRKAKI